MAMEARTPTPEIAKLAPMFSLKGRTFDKALCCSVYDVDTCTFCVELHGEFVRFKARVVGIDGCELRSRDGLEQAMARDARTFAKTVLLNQVCRVTCVDADDKYGRVLVRIVCPDGRDYAEHAIAASVCLAYDGGTKVDHQAWVDLSQREKFPRSP